MHDLQNLTITDLAPPILVHSQKGDTFEMTNRPFYGLSFCISGQITYVMNDKHYVSTPNTAVILPMGASYTLLREKEGLFPLFNFSCENYTCTDIQVIPLPNPKACMQKFNTLQKLFLHGASRLKILSGFYDLLDSVCQETMPTSTLLQSAVQYINETISNVSLSNQLIADQFNISEVYLRKLFHQYMQTTPRQYLLNQRIQRATYLLINTTLSITDIAGECGFSNLYHFCRTFKQRTGLTPSEYAAKNRFYEI